jgi:hypothetical protein
METGDWHIGTTRVARTWHTGTEAESRHVGMAVWRRTGGPGMETQIGLTHGRRARQAGMESGSRQAGTESWFRLTGTESGSGQAGTESRARQAGMSCTHESRRAGMELRSRTACDGGADHTGLKSWFRRVAMDAWPSTGRNQVHPTARQAAGMATRRRTGRARTGPGPWRAGMSWRSKADRAGAKTRTHDTVPRPDSIAVSTAAVSAIPAQAPALGVEALHMNAVVFWRRTPMVEMVVVSPAETRGEGQEHRRAFNQRHRGAADIADTVGALIPGNQHVG